MASPDPAHAAADASRWFALRHALQPAWSAIGRAMRAYSDWLAGISWWRFFLLAILFMAAMGILADMPFFQVDGNGARKVRYVVHVDDNGTVSIVPEDRKASRKTPSASSSVPPAASGAAAKPAPEQSRQSGTAEGVDVATLDPEDVNLTSDGVVIDAHDHSGRRRITIDKRGVHIEKSTEVAAAPAVQSAPLSVPPTPATSAAPTQPEDETARAADVLAQRAEHSAKIEESLAEAVSNLEEIANDREQAARRGALGAGLQNFSVFFILFSVIMKIEAGRRLKVEEVAAEATELAEAEQLKRQLAEARVQAMQAQVEPHFLFNTLASIDHLIETDPPRASAMQKNLIQYLRAALPKMRESTTTLGREIDLIRAYLEILKVRMEDRLTTEYAVPDGLRSAAFPPMMLQSIVENAIKHGLEPKPDGGSIRVAAEIVDGRLRVTVADTGLGFDPQNSSTRGTGLGLANIRERLGLLHDGRGTMSLAPNRPSGTVVSIELPYTFAKSS